MSVLICNRNNCESIMCDSSVENQYVCDSCKEEFIALHTEELPEYQMKQHFKDFMKTKKEYSESFSIELIKAKDLF